MIRVTGLYLYPVKSLRGIAVTVATIDALGFEGDRRFLVTDLSGKFLTQRTHPRLALVETQLTGVALILSAPGFSDLHVPRASDPSASIRPVTVWNNSGLLAEDCGDTAANWLSEFLKEPVRLVRAGEKFSRPVKPSRARPGDVVSFADAHPFLIISQASIDDLNDRLVAQHRDAVPMDRFRPNLVVDGCAPYEEDQWTRLRINEVVFRNSGPSSRCIITTIDQLTAERGTEPLKTLATYRRDSEKPSDVNFGVNLIHETKQGTLSLGDHVTPL
jgi:uncharacterized protein YcbX